MAAYYITASPSAACIMASEHTIIILSRERGRVLDQKYMGVAILDFSDGLFNILFYLIFYV